MKLAAPRPSKAVIYIVLAFVAVAGVLIILKWKDVQGVIAVASWPATVLALSLSLMASICLSYGYVLVNRAFSIRLPGLRLLEIGYVSTMLNNVVALFGAPAHSMRVILLASYGEESGKIIAASLFHSYISNIIMLVLFMVGLIALTFEHVLIGGSVAAVAALAVMIIALFAILSAMIVVRRLRVWILTGVRYAWRFFTRRDISGFVNDLDAALTVGLNAFGKRPILLLALVGVTCAQWSLASASLWACFEALGTPPATGLLLAGFSIGISAGNLSMLPGGLGVQEASMAGVFALLGVSFAHAALAAILFRVANNFFPFFVSLPLYAHLMRQRAPGEQAR